MLLVAHREEIKSSAGTQHTEKEDDNRARIPKKLYKTTGET